VEDKVFGKGRLSSTGMQIVNEQPQKVGLMLTVLMSGQSPDVEQIPMVRVGADWKLTGFPKTLVEGQPPR